MSAYFVDNGIMKRVARPISLTDSTDDTPLMDNAPIEGSLVGTISEHFREAVESCMDQVREKQEATVKAWLYKRGWNGKSIEQAQRLMKGHVVRPFPDGHIEVAEMEKPVTDYCKHLKAVVYHMYGKRIRSAIKAMRYMDRRRI